MSKGMTNTQYANNNLAIKIANYLLVNDRDRFLPILKETCGFEEALFIYRQTYPNTIFELDRESLLIIINL